MQTAKTQPRIEALVAIRDRATTASRPYVAPVRELCGGRSETMSATPPSGDRRKPRRPSVGHGVAVAVIF
jgi:hypothetical protein